MKNSLTKQDLLNCIVKEEYQKMGAKTTVCVLTLKNGFEIVGTSACVDPKNFNEQMGKEISKDVAVNKIWELEGYKLQCELSTQ